MDQAAITGRSFAIKKGIFDIIEHINLGILCNLTPENWGIFLNDTCISELLWYTVNIDFSIASKEVHALFEDLSDLNYIFLRLQMIYHVDLHERHSVIVFDEVQTEPLARQAIKHLVKDHRYDYIETGSLLSIRKNNYTMPSETSNHNYEIDFLLSRGSKICPIEVKSSGYRTHKSLDVFSAKFSDRVLWKYLVYTKDLRKDGDTTMVPMYMVPYL